VWAGDPAAGDAALAPFRSLGEPIADLIHPSAYPEVYPPEDDSYHPTAVSRTMFMDRIEKAEAAEILDRLTTSDASLRVAQLRVLGGAMARVPADATAFAHRGSRILVNVAAFYEGEDDRPRRQAWVDDLAATLRQGDHGAYVNFLTDEGEAHLRSAYPPATLARLREVKDRYDPQNLFRRNHNIAPSAAGDRGG
jgi:FAD/FMN-containing dehydrogenase